jgi:predicted nucleic acid-binding protein
VIVVDTNLVAYLLIKGEHSGLAERVYEVDSEWGAPLLLQSEFRNVLARRVRSGLASLDGVVAAAEVAERLLEERQFQPSGSHVLRLSSESGCTAYDCEFVAVARDLGVPLVTLDREVLRAFPGVAVHPAELSGRRA